MNDLNESGRRDSNSRHPAWKAGALPTELLPHGGRTAREPPTRGFTFLHSGGGRIRTFEGLRRQIYSLIPLATWVPHRLARDSRRSRQPGRADGENRTRNRLITNQVLCQLSYVSAWRDAYDSRAREWSQRTTPARGRREPAPDAPAAIGRGPPARTPAPLRRACRAPRRPLRPVRRGWHRRRRSRACGAPRSARQAGPSPTPRPRSGPPRR